MSPSTNGENIRAEEIELNEKAYLAIEEAWRLTVKARALCPIADDSAIGMTGYISPPWYRKNGATYFVNLAEPLTATDVVELRQIGSFVNRSFIIAMIAILEGNNVIPFQGSIPPGDERDYVQLTKWLRNRFAHGHWEYNANDKDHKETRDLLEELFPEVASGHSGFVTSIDGILEPLKDRVLTYVRSRS